jgi:hypothetical protein
MEESRKSFEVIRQLLLNATDETLDVQTIVDDTKLGAIITNEQERIEFVSKRGGKEWLLSEETKFAGSFTIVGTATIDSDLTFETLDETFTVTATAGQSEIDIASALITAVNTSSGTWTANTTGAGIVRMVPLSNEYSKTGFKASSTDAGVVVSAKSPNQAPFDIHLPGQAKLNGRNAIFQGSAFRTPTP